MVFDAPFRSCVDAASLVSFWLRLLGKNVSFLLEFTPLSSSQGIGSFEALGISVNVSGAPPPSQTASCSGSVRLEERPPRRQNVNQQRELQQTKHDFKHL